MKTHEIHERLVARFGDAVGPLSEAKADPFAVVKPERVVELCRFLKEDPALSMELLEDLTAVDQPKKGLIEVVLHVLSYTHRHEIVLKVELPRAAPAMPTLEGVWKAANWLEREVYDLFGVEFQGHPDLRRILLPDDWVGHPLRKDYQEAGGWHGISNVRENPLVELRRLDEAKRAAEAAAAASAHPERRGAAGAPESKDAPPAPAAPPAPPAPKA